MRNASRMARYMMMADSRSRDNNNMRNEYRGDGMENRSEYRGGEDMRYEMESRERYPRRRDGTFRPRNNRTYEYSMGEDMDMEYSRGGYDTRNEGGRMEMRGGEGSRMNTIGFGNREQANYYPPPWYNEADGNYGMRVESWHGDEMSQRSGMKQHGGASGSSEKMTEDKAKKWVKSMKHADGGRGEHWSYEQIKRIAEEKGGKIEPAELYAVMNSLYADYCSVFQKHGVTSPEFYFDMAKAWIEDSDAVEDKVSMYYECIVKH